MWLVWCLWNFWNELIVWTSKKKMPLSSHSKVIFVFRKQISWFHFGITLTGPEEKKIIYSQHFETSIWLYICLVQCHFQSTNFLQGRGFFPSCIKFKLSEGWNSLIGPRLMKASEAFKVANLRKNLVLKFFAPLRKCWFLKSYIFLFAVCIKIFFQIINRKIKIENINLQPFSYLLLNAR